MCFFSGGGQSYTPPPAPQIPDYSAETKQAQATKAQQNANSNRVRMALSQGPSSLINSSTGFNGVSNGSSNLGSA